MTNPNTPKLDPLDPQLLREIDHAVHYEPLENPASIPGQEETKKRFATYLDVLCFGASIEDLSPADRKTWEEENEGR